jgi:hypothetical protein
MPVGIMYNSYIKAMKKRKRIKNFNLLSKNNFKSINPDLETLNLTTNGEKPKILSEENLHWIFSESYQTKSGLSCFFLKNSAGHK